MNQYGTIPELIEHWRFCFMIKGLLLHRSISDFAREAPPAAV
jgi:hypothetical protein